MANVLIVGSNRGIGLELCRQLSARGDAVTGVCRKASEELSAVDGVQVRVGVDVTDPASLKTLAEKLGTDAFDSLWVVAGILTGGGLEDFDPADVRRQFEVNALGALQTVIALRHTVRDGGKVGLLTSRMGSMTDNGSGGAYGYRMSKAALNAAGVSLAHDLRPRKIAVGLLHPGWVRTDMTRGNGQIDAAESATGLIARLDELTLETSGAFVHQSGERLAW